VSTGYLGDDSANVHKDQGSYPSALEINEKKMQVRLRDRSRPEATGNVHSTSFVLEDGLGDNQEVSPAGL